MKNLSFILMLLIITASACKKDKSQPAVATVAKQDSTIVKPNDTPEAKTVITTYYGKTQYISTLVPPNRIDTTYVDSFTVTENFKDSIVSFSGSFMNNSAKINASNYYSYTTFGSSSGHEIRLVNDSLFVTDYTQGSAAGAVHNFYGKK